MGVVKSCVFFFIIVVELQHIVAQPISFESFFWDLLGGDDDSSDESCDDCSKSTTKAPDQEINIKIPASQGTVLDIINKNGVFTVLVDAQGSGSSAAPGSSTTAAPTTAAAAGDATTAAATTKAA